MFQNQCVSGDTNHWVGELRGQSTFEDSISGETLFDQTILFIRLTGHKVGCMFMVEHFH